MKIKVDYFDNSIEITNDKIYALEIENKSYFYRIINDLMNIYNNTEISENIRFYDNKEAEYTSFNKFDIFVDYFNLSEFFKKYSNEVLKYISNFIEIEDKLEISKMFKRISKYLKKILNDIDLPLSLNDDIDINYLLTQNYYYSYTLSKTDISFQYNG